MRLHLRRGFRPRDELLLRQVGRNLEAVAHLSVHLDDELERVLLEHGRIGLRPGLQPQPLVSEPLPQLLRDVRGVRLDQ